MPIGNLTSQLLANIYLNEFDRFVRHTLKPLGYVRYGDDFILMARDRRAAETMRQSATKWLADELFSIVHSDNDAIFQVRQGARFLGHRTYPTSFVIEPAMMRKITRQISSRNAASYQAQAMPSRRRKQLVWHLVEKSLYEES